MTTYGSQTTPQTERRHCKPCARETTHRRWNDTAQWTCQECEGMPAAQPAASDDAPAFEPLDQSEFEALTSRGAASAMEGRLIATILKQSKTIKVLQEQTLRSLRYRRLLLQHANLDAMVDSTELEARTAIEIAKLAADLRDDARREEEALRG